MESQASISRPRNWGRIRIAWSDGPAPFRRFSLPPQRTWLAALVTGGLCVGFAMPWVDDIRELFRYDTQTVGDLMSLLFVGFGTLVWSVAVLLLFLATIALLLYRDEYRVGAGKLAFLARMGPLRIFREYDLARIRKLRTGSFAREGLANICFEYEDITGPFGRPLPKERLPEALEFIRQALDSPADEDAAASRPDPEPEFPYAEFSSQAESPDRPAGWLSIVFLVGANLVPLVGVLLFDWDLAQIMVLFWVENGVIGFYALLKLAVIQRWGALVFGPLFLGHFGAFMAIHLMFVYSMFVRGMNAKGPEPDVWIALGALFAPLWTAVLAMFVSHGVSFFSNFIGRHEYRGRTGVVQMFEPYRRVALMHATLIFGGFAVMALGQPVYALLVLVSFKIAMDLRAHLRERRGPRFLVRPVPTAAA